VVDSSTITTISNNIKYEYIQAIIEMVKNLKIIKNLEIMLSGERFDATVRGLIMALYDMPVKVIYVNLFPYD